MSANQNAAAAALQLTKGVYEAIRPDAAVLFGSRARGDHDEHRSDVDIIAHSRAAARPMEEGRNQRIGP